MNRFIFAVVVALCMPTVCFGQLSLVGTYRLVSWWNEIEGEPRDEVFGKSPHGYIIITPKRFMAVLTAEGRKAGRSISEKAALWDSLISYSGSYEVEGNKLIISVDVSWNENWNGNKQVRFWEVDGNRLILRTPSGTSARDPSKTRVGHLVWERIE